MDFFAQQDDARRRTGHLLFYYALAVCGIILTLYAVLTALLAWREDATTPAADSGFWHPELLLAVAIVTLLIVGIGTLFKTAQLSHGGSVVARMLGGRLVAPDTEDPEEQRLLHVVEEMSIASGLAMPGVYVLDQEPAVNAFAAGFSGADAVIGVTRGTIHSLSRDELQGVIAHEFSHIANGDMRLNIRLMGILHGILLIALIGYMLMRSAAFSGRSARRSRNSKGDMTPVLLIGGLAMVIIGYIGVFFANLIKSAVSRQREFLADASAVQYTRNPSGLSGALKRIAAMPAGTRIRDSHAAEASHLFFGNALGHSMLNLLATHPPIRERIRRLDPSVAATVGQQPTAPADGFVSEAGPLTAFASPGGGIGVDAGSIGASRSHPLEFARRQLESLPNSLLSAVHDTTGARAVVYALLLQDADPIRSRQLAAIESDPPVLEKLESIQANVAPLLPADRLSLANLALPALRRMSPEIYGQFDRALTSIIAADDQVNLLEYALKRMLQRHLAPTFGKTDTAPVRFHAVEDIRSATIEILTALAVWGSADAEAAATAAFLAGVRILDPDADPPPPFNPGTASLTRVDQALTHLAQAAPPLKKRVLQACAACVSADGRIGNAQAELLRAVADALDCPIPPVLFGPRDAA